MPSTSNRSVPGRISQGARAAEPSAAEKVAMGRHLQRELPKYSSCKEFFKTMSLFHGRRRKQLQKSLQELNANLKFMKDRILELASEGLSLTDLELRESGFL